MVESGQDWKIASLTTSIYVRYFYGVKFMNGDMYYMNEALQLAKKAYSEDETPVGAVIVENNEIIGYGYNQKDKLKVVTKHAELLAIEEASKYKNDWRLNDATLYVTMEPCPMCASAIQQARIARIVYGCSSNNDDNIELLYKIMQNKKYNHQVIIDKGIMEEECSAIIKKFFSKKR